MRPPELTLAGKPTIDYLHQTIIDYRDHSHRAGISASSLVFPHQREVAVTVACFPKNESQ